MKKVIPLSFLVIVSVAVALFFVANPLRSSDSLKLFQKEGLSSEQAGRYLVSLKATRSRKGQAAEVISQIDGKLLQYEQSPSTIVSRWSEISGLSIQDRQASVSEIHKLLAQSVVSRAEKGNGYVHYFAADFPEQWYRLQLNLLQRSLIPPRETEKAIFQKRESEEMGDHLVEYTDLDRGDHRDVKKTYISYDNPQIVMDRSDNTVHTLLSPDGRLISTEGTVSFVHHAAGSDRFTIALKIGLIEVGPKPAGEDLDISSMELADESRVRLVALQNRANDSIGFDEALKLLPQITASTDGRDLSLIYTGLKQELRARPERAIDLRNFILLTKGRDVGSKRQLAAAFGALAQSDQAPIANLLARLAKECGDVFCKDQAIVALNDHTKPTVESGKAMIELVKNQPDYDTAAAAVLAIGSIAYKIGSELPEVAPTLIEAYRKPENATLKRSFLAAMGNHGDSRYLSLLKESLDDKDSSVRGTAFYSFRHLKGDAVDEILVSAIVGEKSSSAVNEGIKAIAFRNLEPGAYERIAHRLASIQKQEEAKEATRLFMKIYERQPEKVGSAMAILRERSNHSIVKAGVARVLKENATF